MLGVTTKAGAVTNNSSAESNAGPQKFEIRVANLHEQYNETQRAAVNRADLPSGSMRPLNWGNWQWGLGQRRLASPGLGEWWLGER
jgi:hypothetical protein